MNEDAAKSEDVKDDLLSKAAAEAVGEEIDEIQAEEAQEETEVVETAEQTEQKERSKLGRTVAALHRRLDEADQKGIEQSQRIERLLELIEERNAPEESDPDEPVTRAELDRFIEKREAKRKEQEDNLSRKYHEGYSLKWAELSSGLSEDEYKAVVSEAEKMKYDPSDNPAVDAQLNFKEAQLRYLKKQLAPAKKNPLEGNTPSDGIGVVTAQKTAAKDISLPKLDGAAKSYLDYISQEDGAEAAAKIHRSLK